MNEQFRVFYRDDNGTLWAIPYPMRAGQQPADILPQFRHDWTRLSGRRWIGDASLMDAEKLAGELCRHRGEWADAKSGPSRA